jgi:hypothetical protein
VAGEVEAIAARVRAEADDHYRRARQVRWVSSAADAYRGVALTDHEQAHRVADSLLGAAASLRDHAAQARETWSLIGRLDDIAIQFFRRVIAWGR